MIVLLPMLIGFAMGSVEREIAFKTPDGLELRGTFLVPEGAKNAKAVLLLPGSGPTDRNGNQPGFQADLLKDLATVLAEKGVATFRFDKRAARPSASQWPKDVSQFDEFFSFEHHITDAIAGLETLRRQPEVDGKHVGIAGHSEGGLIALAVGERLGPEKVAGLALLSTAGRPLDIVLEDQIDNLLKRQTSDVKVQTEYMANLREAIAHVKANGTKPPQVLPGLAALFSPGTAKYFQTILALDPASLLKGYGGEVLVVQGEMDSQVSATKDFPILKTIAESKKKAKTVLVPKTSHNLKSVVALTDPGISGPPALDAVEALTEWATVL